MQQRRLRLGDIVDDYCPRERRITNHAIVAMIEDQVKQTRCTTCDADHEYKQAKIPAQRRKKDGSSSLVGDAPAGAPRKRGPEAPEVIAEIEASDISSSDIPEGNIPDSAIPMSEPPSEVPESVAAAAESFENPEGAEPSDGQPSDDDGPVHRRLIRATLPRVEGQTPERKAPEFTIHQRETNGNRAGRGPRRGPRQGQRNAQQHGGGGQQSRFGGQRQGQGHGGQSTRHGSGQSRHGSGQSGQGGSGHGGQGNTGHGGGNRFGQGQHRQNRPGGGGRKRGR